VARPTKEVSAALRRLGVKRLSDVELRAVVEAHIRKVLQGCQGNVSLAATVLRLHRRSLQRKLTAMSPARAPASRRRAR
jgi:ActR/RegA family two-component response regulator